GRSNSPISVSSTPPPPRPLPTSPFGVVAVVTGDAVPVPVSSPPPQPTTSAATSAANAATALPALGDDLPLVVDGRLRRLVADRDNELALDLSAVGGDALGLPVEAGLDAVVESVGTG